MSVIETHTCKGVGETHTCRGVGETHTCEGVGERHTCEGVGGDTYMRAWERHIHLYNLYSLIYRVSTRHIDTDTYV